MSLVTTKITRDTATPLLRQQARALAQLPAQAFDVWRATTPRRTGNARRKTRLVRDTIQANYAYAGALDRGSSQQAPRGMFEPTLAWIRQQLNKIFRG